MNNEIVKTLLYTSEDGAVAIKVIIDSENDTMWTTQKTMAELQCGLHKKPWQNYLAKISIQ